MTVEPSGDPPARNDPEPGRRLRPRAVLVAACVVAIGLAAAVGINTRQINRYEAGRAAAGPRLAQRLAVALGVTLDELAGSPPRFLDAV